MSFRMYQYTTSLVLQLALARLFTHQYTLRLVLQQALARLFTHQYTLRLVLQLALARLFMFLRPAMSLQPQDKHGRVKRHPLYNTMQQRIS